MFVRSLRYGLTLLACLLFCAVCPAQNLKPSFNRLTASRYIYFYVPGAQVTYPTSINDSLCVTGTYSTSEGLEGGFVRTAYGQLTTFDAGQVYTGDLEINALGEIGGVYQDISGENRGFIRSADGSITKFNPGGSSGFTSVSGINNRGAVVGIYSTTNSIPPAQAYVRNRDGALTTFTIPGSSYVYPYSINDLGEVTGFYYYDGDTQVGGFVRSPGGMITTFDYAAGITPLAINLAGTTIGWYGPLVGSFQGFVRTADGIITPYSLPGQVSTEYMGLNQAGFVAGSYQVFENERPPEPSEFTYGFVRSPNGVITSFEAPGAYNTVATDINNLNVIVGWSDAQSELGGFLRMPDAVAF